MADTLNETMENGTGTENQERTFTQEELNSIIEGRLRKESAKYADYEELKAKASKFDEMEEASKSELQKATEKADALQKKLDSMIKANDVRTVREKVQAETGIPATLLSGENEDDCMEQAKAILAYMNENAVKPTKYPTVKDGGEPQNRPTNKTTGEQFGEWLSGQLKL